jgi:hypothetical protein
VIRRYLEEGDRARLLEEVKERGYPSSLAECVELLWRRVGAPERALRERATAAFAGLVPLLKEVRVVP